MFAGNTKTSLLLSFWMEEVELVTAEAKLDEEPSDAQRLTQSKGDVSTIWIVLFTALLCKLSQLTYPFFRSDRD